MGKPQNPKVCSCEVSSVSLPDSPSLDQKATEAVRQFFYDWAVYDHDLAWALTGLLDILNRAYPELEAPFNAWQDLAIRHDDRMRRAKTLMLHFQPVGEFV